MTAQNAGAIRIYRRIGFRFRKTIYMVVEAAGAGYPLVAPDWCL